VNQSNLLVDLRSILPSLLFSTPVLLAYLYGSTAEGKTTCLSDVDIALLLDPKQAKGMHPYDRLIFETDIALELEQLIKLPETDVRIINDAPLLLRGRVVQRGHLLYSSDEDFRICYETMTLKEYLDFLPIAEQFQRSYFERRLAELNVADERITS
jgi:predicted nucleotidyltransferase